jgi:hypothetical protein
MKRCVLTIGLLLAACGPARPRSTAPEPGSSAGRAVIPLASAEPEAEPAPAAPADPIPAPDIVPVTACPPPDDGAQPSAICRLCSPRRSTPLLQIVLADLLTLPTGASIIAQSPAAKAPRQLEYTLVVTEERLVAQVFTCPGCRRRIGWGFDAALEDVRELDDDTRRALQKAVGVPEFPLLGTADEWRGAQVTRTPSAAPLLPGCAPGS